MAGAGDRGQRRVAQLRPRDVVHHRDRHVGGDAQVQLAGDQHGRLPEQVPGGEDRGDVGAALQQPGRGGVGGVAGRAGGDDQVLLQRDAEVGEGAAEGALAHPGGGAGGAAEEGDAPVPEPGEVLGEGPHAARVVGEDGRDVRQARQHPVGEHHAGAHPGGGAPVGRLPGGHRDDAVHPLLDEPLHDLGLAGRVAVRGVDDDVLAEAAGAGQHAGDQLGAERVGDVRDDQPDAAAAAQLEAPAEGARAVVQLAGGGQHALAGGRAHRAAGEHAGHGGDADARRRGHVLDGRRPPIHPRPPVSHVFDDLIRRSAPMETIP
ncbi:Uncharacterised protein [Mycobacterium tuberculosis]|nr:Uncharacterised protein [Mycobacterium tuberculosis]